MNFTGGYILQPRSFDASDSAHLPPATRELWFYLLRNVNFADNGKYKRGQGFFCFSDIQDDLSWFVGYRKMVYSKPQITKALRRLNEETMTETTKATRGVVITVLNYNEYQDPGNYEGNGEGSTKETRRKREGLTKNKKVEEVKKEKKKEVEPSPPNGEVYVTKKGRNMNGKRLETFKTFWDHFNYKEGKAEAADSWFDIPNLTNQICEEIYTAAQREAGGRQELRDRGSTPKMAQGWLSGRRWEDEVEAVEQTTPARGLNFNEANQ